MVGGTRRGVGCAVVVAALTLAGCATDAAAPPGTVSTTPAGGIVSASASVAPEGPAAPAPTTPATTAGSLVLASLPEPSALGPRWEYAVDEGDPEGNYVGNGTPAQSRDPGEVVSALVPPGCAVESVYDIALARPAYALEVAYAHPAGVNGVALGLEFADEAQARSFVRSYAGALTRCTPIGGAPAGAVVVTALEAPGGAAALTRIEDPVERTTWTELLARRGAIVTVLGVDTADASALPLWGVVARSR